MKRRLGLQFPSSSYLTSLLNFRSASLISELDAHFDSIMMDLKLYPLTSDVWQSFIQALCNPETYFFREMAQIKRLAELLIKERKRRLRIWSVPSSGGEELFSIIMVLDAIGITEIDGFGSEIRLDLVGKAKRGSYDNQSFFDPPPSEYHRYFSGENLAAISRVSFKTQTVSIAPSLISRIQFQFGNILDPITYPWGNFDVIFCRNLLIYFESDANRRIIAALWDKLSPGGYLCLGNSDFIYEFFSIMDNLEDTIGHNIYRKRNGS